MKLYKRYDHEIPQEATRIISSLDDPIRRAILVLLSKKNELSFSDVREELGLTKLTLNYHLKNLYAAGLADHYFRHELGNQKYSYYSITSLGKRVLSNLINALIPPTPFQKIKQGETSTIEYDLTITHTYTCFADYLDSNKQKIVKDVATSGAKTQSLGANSLTNSATYSKSDQI